MHLRRNPATRADFERLVQEARFERAVYVGEALAEASAALWKGITRAVGALRSSFGLPASSSRLASKRPLAVR